MKYDYIVADSHADAIMETKKKYGDEARIINSKIIKTKGAFGLFKKNQYQLLVSITDDEHLKNYKKQLGITSTSENKTTPPVEKKNTEKTNTNQTSNNESLDNNTVKMIFENLQKIEKQINSNSENRSSSKHRNIEEIKDILLDNEFSDDFINTAVKEMESKLSLSVIEERVELHKWAYDYIQGKISEIVGNDEIIYNRKKNVMILIGPTGVGKTTTIAKIAANSYKNEKKTVELVTIDGFRIGAKYQLSIYAEHMKMKLHFAESNLDIEKAISLSDSDVILIDTIGRSQLDELKLVEMKSILKLRNVEPVFVLAISATTKPKDIKKIFKNFDIFDFTHVIITKNDESESVGGILSAAIEKNKRILYCTNGQRVPNDIEKSSVRLLMDRIRGLDSSIYLMNAVY